MPVKSRLNERQQIGSRCCSDPCKQCCSNYEKNNCPTGYKGLVVSCFGKKWIGFGNCFLYNNIGVGCHTIMYLNSIGWLFNGIGLIEKCYCVVSFHFATLAVYRLMASPIIICPKIILFLCRCLLYYVDIFELMIGTEIHFAPIQGYTDNEYRNVHSAFFGGIDFYYTPYLSVENSGNIKLLTEIERVPDQLKSLTIPQLLAANINETKTIANHIAHEDFKMVNLNLGCPYPMVTRKGRGAALIGKPLLVKQMVEMLIENFGFTVSLKMRSGLESEYEIFTFLDCFPHSIVKQIIVHPRVALQLYKGKADVEIFGQCKEMYPETDFVYNGDIASVSDFNRISTIFPDQKKWMIGRGLMLNPALASEIKTEKKIHYINKKLLLLHLPVCL